MKSSLYFLIFILMGFGAKSQISNDSVKIRTVSLNIKNHGKAGPRKQAITLVLTTKDLNLLSHTVASFRKKGNMERINSNNLKISDKDLNYIESIYALKLVEGNKINAVKSNRININGKGIFN